MKDTVFAARTTYNEEMYYHQILAAKIKETPKKKTSILDGLDFSQLILVPVVFVVFYVTFAQMEMMERIGQSLLSTVLACGILYYMNKKKKGNEKNQKSHSGGSYDRNQAKALLENSGLSNVKCNLQFGEESFQAENPGITTEYKYEGISWIKETGKYYLIFWNRSMVIAVEKSGFYKGRPEQFGAFMERKCQKTIERVKT